MTKEERKVFDKLSNRVVTQFIALEQLMAEHESSLADSMIMCGETLRRLRTFLIEQQRKEGEEK